MIRNWVPTPVDVVLTAPGPTLPTTRVMARRVQGVFRVKPEKRQEDSKARGMAVPSRRAPPGPPVANPLDSSLRERPSTSKASKTQREPAPEVVEMRKQFQLVEEQLMAVTRARKVAEEKREREKKEKKEQEEKKKEAEKAKSLAKELLPASAKGSRSSSSSSSSSRTSEKQREIRPKQSLSPQQQKTTLAESRAKDRTRYMTRKDKCQLARDLSKLPEKKLGGLARILRSREPKFKKISNNRMDVNLGTLKLSTLWELKDYLESCLQKAEKAAAGPAEAVASTSGSGSQSTSQTQAQSESESEWESTSSDDS